MTYNGGGGGGLTALFHFSQGPAGQSCKCGEEIQGKHAKCEGEIRSRPVLECREEIRVRPAKWTMEQEVRQWLGSVGI